MIVRDYIIITIIILRHQRLYWNNLFSFDIYIYRQKYNIDDRIKMPSLFDYIFKWMCNKIYDHISKIWGILVSAK